MSIGAATGFCGANREASGGTVFHSGESELVRSGPRTRMQTNMIVIMMPQTHRAHPCLAGLLIGPVSQLTGAETLDACNGHGRDHSH